MIDISKKIRRACEVSGISVAQLARALGTTRQAFWQRLKTGKFSSEELEKIAKATGSTVSVRFIFQDGTEI